MTAVACPELAHLFTRVCAGPITTLGDLSLVPILLRTADDAGADANLLEEGLHRGWTTVTEVSEGGAVGRVRVTHLGVRALLLVDGEQILGAKQNRVFNASFLVPPGGVVEVPVSCVERDRWRYESSGFRASETTMTSILRAEKLKRVTGSIAARGSTELGTPATYEADQRAVWRDVDAYLGRTHTGSRTSAFDDAVRTKEPEVQARLAQLTPLPDQVGLAGVRGDKLVSLDVFGSPALFARGFKKIARGLLSEVFEGAQPSRDAASVVQRALSTLAGLPVVRQTAPGMGETLHGESREYVAGAIVHGLRLYHAVVAAA